MDRREENGASLDGDKTEKLDKIEKLDKVDGEEDARSQRRRRTSGANGATAAGGISASRSGEAARSNEPANRPTSGAPANRSTAGEPSNRPTSGAPANRPTSGVPARGARPSEAPADASRDTRNLPASPLHEALRGTRSSELPRVESPRMPRQPAFESAKDALPGDFGDFTPPTQPIEALSDATSIVDASALRASIKQNDGLYRSTKPAFAVLYGLLAAIGEILMFRPFLAGAFKLTAGTALAPLLAIVAFPFLAIGLYGLSTGAATAVQFQGPRVWLRTPLVYLPIALLLLIAAGAAA